MYTYTVTTNDGLQHKVKAADVLTSHSTGVPVLVDDEQVTVAIFYNVVSIVREQPNLQVVK
jgi:hypothetical protein